MKARITSHVSQAGRDCSGLEAVQSSNFRKEVSIYFTPTRGSGCSVTLDLEMLDELVPLLVAEQALLRKRADSPHVPLPVATEAKEQRDPEKRLEVRYFEIDGVAMQEDVWV